MLTNHAVLLKRAGKVVDFESPSQTKNRDISRLLNDLIKVRDENLELVTPVVRATENGVLFDIFFNGVSIGYNAVKAFCNGTSLTTPEIVARGVDLEPSDDCYEISLTGAAA